MRSLLIAGLFALLALPASAEPISYVMTGTFDAGYHLPPVFPDLSDGLTWSASFIDSEDPTSGGIRHFDSVISFGAYEVTAETLIDESLRMTMGEGQFGASAGHMTKAGIAPVYVLALFFRMDAGWQSGTFDFWGDAYIPTGDPAHPFVSDQSANWRGTITSVVQTPEPATLLLSVVGAAIGLARRRRPQEV